MSEESIKTVSRSVGDATSDRAACTAESPWREAWRMYCHNRAALLGLGLLLIIMTVSFLGPWVYPVDPFEIVWAPFTAPGQVASLPLGTDHVGRNILAGILHGGAATFAVAGSAALITVVIGILVGAMAGYYGGVIEEVLMRVTEFFQVMPPLILAMVLVAVFSPSLATIAIAIGIVSWPSTARLARVEFMKVKELDYVKAARTNGARDRRIIWLVILPNVLPPLIISATLVIGVAILFEAGLSFLGLGDPNVMSWGMMIGASREYLLDAWWAVTFPGVAIFLTVLSFSLIGDGLNDALNPKLRER